MNDDIIASWVEELLLQCARWNIVFVQLGGAYPVARTSIAPRVDSVVSVIDYLAASELPGTLRLITELEALLEPGAPSLGQLRERVIADRDSGVRVVLLSRRPKIAFPTVPGSQVLRDAKLVPPPLYQSNGSWQFGEEAVGEGVPPDVVVLQALRELGEVACAELDAMVFEDGRGAQQLESLAEPLQDALVASGMVTRDTGDLEWTISNAHLQVRSALSDVIAGMRRPQEDLAAVSANCWIVERLVKQALRARARALWGEQWGVELLGHAKSKLAFSRATAGTYPGAAAVDELRDPLEWLTLGETLDLLADPQVGTLGVNKPMWALMRTELLPVKDRVERSQLIRKSDSDVAHRWAEHLSQRLSTSGSRSSAESFALATATQRDVLERLRANLGENPRLSGDVEKDLMSLVLATVKFLAHTLDTHPEYTAALDGHIEVPLERVLQNAFKAYLDMSDLAGRAAVEVSSIAGGRADVVLYFNDGTRYITEVKRELKHGDRDALEAAYLPQAVAYQSANVPFGQLLVLDLSPNRASTAERLGDSIWVAHRRTKEGAVISSTVVAVVRGNRATPSARKE